MKRFYLDYAAGAPLKSSARDAMKAWIDGEGGNASSLHLEGQTAKRKVDEAREVISQELGCLFGEVIFTSGGTEAVNTAILGLASANQTGSRKKILMTAVEHHCVLQTAPKLQAMGYEVQLIPVDQYGIVLLDELSQMLDRNTLLVCCMHCNNELGSYQPVDEVIRLSHEVGAFVFMDAIQTFQVPDESGQPWTLKEIDADMVAISSHKIGGPTGAGALYVRSGIQIDPLIVGGGQEREMRAGTEAVINIVGFAAAAQQPYNNQRRRAIKEEFRHQLFESGTMVVGTILDALEGIIDSHPAILNILCPYPIAESILIRLDQEGISAASGAACSSGAIEASHVLTACGYTAQHARGSLRFSFGDDISDQDAVDAADISGRIISELCDDQYQLSRPPLRYMDLPGMVFSDGIGLGLNLTKNESME